MEAIDNLALTHIEGTPVDELPSRLVALQQQLERLDTDRFLLQQQQQQQQQHHHQQQRGSPNSTGIPTGELSLASLKKRLSEVRQQLYGGTGHNSLSTVSPSSASLSHMAKHYFGGMLSSPPRHRLFLKRRAHDNNDNTGSGAGPNPNPIINSNGNSSNNDEELEGGNDFDDVEDDLYDADDIIEFAGDGGDYNYEFDISEGELFEEELLSAAAAAGIGGASGGNFLDATRLGLRLFNKTVDGSRREEDQVQVKSNQQSQLVNAREAATVTTQDGSGAALGAVVALTADPSDYEVVTKAEAELDAALDLVASPALTNERKMEILREKFAAVIRDDLHWRGRLTKATRVAHDERLQRQLIEMELDKANAIKHRLESLCRDLHAENRRIKAERSQLQEKTTALTAAMDREGAAILATSAEFGNFFGAGNSSSSSTPVIPDRTRLAQETPEVLADRLVGLVEWAATREQHFATLLRARDVELALATERASSVTTQLTKVNGALDASTRRIATLTRSETDLKGQVRQYVEKFRQVEETLGKSNDLFGTFRAEMEQMGAKLARLEKENAQLSSKCATLSRNIIEMADERTKQNATLETIKGQKAKLEQLCRTLQAERNAALKGGGTTGTTGSNGTTPAVTDP